MVEFLRVKTMELQAAATPSRELLVLAEKVQTMLAAAPLMTVQGSVGSLSYTAFIFRIIFAVRIWCVRAS